jgi:predicted RNA-binding protein with PIN domain
VRRQIAWAKYRREMTQQATGSFRQKNTVRTKFRKNVNETELAELLDYRKRNRDLGMNETNWNATSGKPPPLLLVDGYNIIHKWARLKKHLHRGDLYHARELLIADLEQLQSWKHWTIECVFDGAGAGGGTTATASRFGNIQVVFTGRGVETAEAYVEQTCQRVAATGASVMVASDDAVIRSVIQGYGQEGQNWNAIHMSADRLIDELKASRAVISYLVEATVANINGHGIRPAALRSTSAMTGFTNRPVFVHQKKNETKQDEEISDVTAATTAVEDDDDITLPSAPAPAPAASKRQKSTSKKNWIVL